MRAIDLLVDAPGDIYAQQLRLSGPNIVHMVLMRTPQGQAKLRRMLQRSENFLQQTAGLSERIFADGAFLLGHHQK